MKWLCVYLVFLPLWAQSGTAGSGTTFQEQTDRLQNIQAYLLDFRPNSAPTTVNRRSLEFTLDLAPQPSVDTRVGLKDEPVDPPSFVPKLRGRLLFPIGIYLGAAYAPGIEFEGYEAQFLAMELGFRKKLMGFDWGLRTSFSDGEVDGAITEPDVTDHFEYRNFGVDLSGGKSWGSFACYFFVGGNEIETSVEVESDGARLANEDKTWYGGLGAAYQLSAWRFHFEQNFTDSYLAAVTVGVTRRF